MKRLWILTFLGVFWGAAFAGVDQGVDQIGVYFDLEAESVCRDVPPGTPFEVYVILTNPTRDRIDGFEFKMCPDVVDGPRENFLSLISHFNCALDFDTRHYCEDYIEGACVSPILPAGDPIVLARFQFLLVEYQLEVDYYLLPSGSPHSDDDLPVYFSGQETVPMGVSSGDPSIPVAKVNGDCDVVAGESAAFGTLKALYR